VVGQELWIPDRRTDPRVARRPRLHTVRRGETLSHLAQRYGTSVRALMRVNRLGSSRLRIGKTLRIPDRV
jgi:LysM repeat protein